MKIVGFKHSFGDFTDGKTGELKNYDNVELYLVGVGLSNVVGSFTDSKKIKTADFVKMSGVPVDKLDSLIDKEVILESISQKDKVIITGIHLLGNK